VTDELTPAEQYRRQALRFYSMVDAAGNSAAVRSELFRMARMYEALSLQADSTERRGMLPFEGPADNASARPPAKVG
jgi:hypothetical protein